MPDRLVVVVGAGASSDCRSHHVKSGLSPAWQPPLVRELFDQRFAGVINRYPMAQYAAADIRRVDPSALSIEQFLRENYKAVQTELAQRKYHSIPYYLQDLLLGASLHYTPHPDNYDLLISYLIDEVDMDVLLVTLNYDVILDRRLHVLSPLNSLDAYISHDREWSLIKLHGSVDWGRIVRGDPVDAFNPPPVIEAGDIVLARDDLFALDASRLPEMRYRDVPPHGVVSLFPALSVPLGEEDEISCPQNHVTFLVDQIQAAEGLHLLLIGYSAIDLEVLSLLGKTDTPVRTTAIVNIIQEAAQDVYRRLTSATLARPRSSLHLGRDLWQLRSTRWYAGASEPHGALGEPPTHVVNA